MARRRRLAALVALAGTVVSGCRLIGSLPEPTTLEQRIAMMPTSGLALEAPVTVRWNAHQVPYVFAQSDEDAAYALGLVHAHLRLGQMETLRRVIQGRIAEMAGPTASKFDAAIRAIGLYRAAEASVAAMPPETRRWVERFVAGINDYKAKSAEAPYEVRALLLDQDDSPWKAEDVVAIGRIGSVDVSWFDWLRLLPGRSDGDWDETLAEALAPAFEDPVSFGGSDTAALEAEGVGETPARGTADASTPAGREALAFLNSVKRSGSNSMVVGASKTGTGASMIASDPHLGFVLPNIWLIAGLKTPDLSVVGLMGPGLPIFALGRTPQIAWGGTNLHAASSDLVDVSGLDPSAIAVERHSLGVRGWFDREAENGLTPYGPVITDVEVVRDALGLKEDDQARWALRWTGHLPSDEITSLLRVLRAQSFEDFRGAFAGFSLPGQNMLYADASGGIGHILAVKVPGRAPERPKDLIITPDQADRDWASLFDATTLPFAADPAAGFLASSNNRPTPSDVPIGYFYGQPDRFLRARSALSAAQQVSLEDLKGLQQDTLSVAARGLRDDILARLIAGFEASGLALDAAQAKMLGTLRAWDGRYERNAPGPVVFETLLVTMGDRLLPESLAPRITGDTNRYKKRFKKALDAADGEAVTAAGLAGLDAAAKALRKFPAWGDMHRLALRHPLALAPVVGGKFPTIEVPASGTSESLMKTAHPATKDRHQASYGSQARHVSDLSDPDANYFLLAGGQDGWLNSDTFADQVDLWQAGDYIRMPLTQEAIEAAFPIVMTLTP